MTDKQKIKLALHYVSLNNTWEDVEIDLTTNVKVTDREKEMAQSLGDIYTLLHPSKKCRHMEWEKGHEAMLDKLKGEV